MLCKAPFLGLTIDPSGWLALCCATNNRQYFKTRVQDVEDLNDFFLGEEYEHLRKQMKSDGLGSISQCAGCWGSMNGEWSEADNYNLKNYEQPLKIRYLELTTSNTCNQTCVTCTSYFSSKWRKLEKEFGRRSFPSYHLKEDSVEKIFRVLPDLKYLQIKGGEPFADKNNLRILKELAAVNPNCELTITSNFQNIPDEWYDTLMLLKNISVGASIDGINEGYDWIRGGSFDKTVTNMKDFYEVTGKQVVVNTCVSLYNITVLDKIYDYFNDKEYVMEVIFNNIVQHPHHLSIGLMKKSKIIDLVGSRDEKFNNIRSVVPVTGQPGLQTMFFKHTETMNKIRGFNIFDIQPELYDIFK